MTSLPPRPLPPRPLLPQEGNRTIGCENELQLVMHRLACGVPNERSEGVTLLLASHDEAIKTLFHAPIKEYNDGGGGGGDGGSGDGGGGDGGGGGGGGGAANFEARVLSFGVFFVFSFGLALLTYGAAVPSVPPPLVRS